MTYDAVSAFLISVQHKLFYLIMAFARFNLYANSYTFLFKKAFDTKRARGGGWSWGLEVVGLMFFWCWYGRLLYSCGSWGNALAYLIVSHTVTSPLHVQVFSLANSSCSKLLIKPTDRFVSFLNAHGRPWPNRVVSTPPTTHNDRRHLSSFPRLSPWGSPSPSNTPPFPSAAET
jgi:hypothetical protein